MSQFGGWTKARTQRSSVAALPTRFSQPESIYGVIVLHRNLCVGKHEAVCAPWLALEVEEAI